MVVETQRVSLLNRDRRGVIAAVGAAPHDRRCRGLLAARWMRELRRLLVPRAGPHALV
jgi:hypothetical protein